MVRHTRFPALRLIVALLGHVVACDGAPDVVAPVASDSLPLASRFSQVAVNRNAGAPPRIFELAETDSTIELRGWIQLGSPSPLRSVAWVRDSVVTVAISSVPCTAALPEICVEFAMLTEYEYTVSLGDLPVQARTLEVRHRSAGALGPGTLAFASRLPARGLEAVWSRLSIAPRRAPAGTNASVSRNTLVPTP